MQVGFTMDFRNPKGEPWREFWQERLWLMAEAEAMGFDYLSVQEHFFTSDGYAPSVPVFLTALIERTKTIRVGTYTYILPLHNAVQLAQETAVLDQLSGGRLDVCVGGGHRPAEYAIFGLDPKTRPSRMEEGLKVLKAAWTQRPFSFDGRYHNLRNVTVTPEPFQTPHPRLWVAATSPAAAERAGRHGANLHGAASGDEFYAAYQRGLGQAGIDPKTMRISTPISFTLTDEDPEAVWARNRALYFERWNFYNVIRTEMGDPDLHHEDHKGPEPSPEDYRPAEVIGDAQAALAAVRERVDAAPSITDIMHSGPAGGIDIRGEAYPSLKRFADEVLPVLKSW
jgi:alkanesulfonate monooxygenase SsuD/methylene tetrahydromethanopterin reductase-like flavin-dependent oxidoreductase (luciferase family)